MSNEEQLFKRLWSGGGSSEQVNPVGSQLMLATMFLRHSLFLWLLCPLRDDSVVRSSVRGELHCQPFRLFTAHSKELDLHSREQIQKKGNEEDFVVISMTLGQMNPNKSEECLGEALRIGKALRIGTNISKGSIFRLLTTAVDNTQSRNLSILLSEYLYSTDVYQLGCSEIGVEILGELVF